MLQAGADRAARAGIAGTVLIAVAFLGTGGLRARELTFEERVEAQRAVERVYYSHRIGASRSFEEAVPRRALERKVRTYLSQSVALEKIWKSPIDAGALRRELERIAANTRFPKRLREMYEALDRDPYLIQETFVRAALADRLARGYFAGAPPGGSPPDWETWWESAGPEFDPALVKDAAQYLQELPDPGPREDAAGTALNLAAGPSESGDDTGSCELQDIWSGAATDDPPTPRAGHTAVWTGSEMIIWGGGDLTPGARYDPLTDAWRTLPLNGAPPGRTDHSAVWTGSVMIVWGDTPAGDRD